MRGKKRSAASAPAPALYRFLAGHYDRIYAGKDYEKEAAVVARLVLRHKKSAGQDLLDAACGTGAHARRLKKYFCVTGVDSSAAMLAVARRNAAGVAFRRADMTRLHLRKKFDAVICLFGSIGYAKTRRRVKETLARFARCLKPGGVAVVEPWLSPSAYEAGMPHMTAYDGKDMKIARLSMSKLRGRVSVLDMRYLLVERGKPVRHLAERHELGLFEPREYVRMMEEAGLRTRFLKNGLTRGRGLLVGVKRQALCICPRRPFGVS